VIVVIVCHLFIGGYLVTIFIYSFLISAPISRLTLSYINPFGRVLPANHAFHPQAGTEENRDFNTESMRTNQHG